jgi:hypothetical protein
VANLDQCRQLCLQTPDFRCHTFDFGDTGTLFVLCFLIFNPGALPASCTMGTGVLCWGVKRPGRGVDHPPAFIAGLKKEYSCTSTPPPLGPHGLF